MTRWLVTGMDRALHRAFPELLAAQQAAVAAGSPAG